MRVLMLGWEFPPYVSGGLGTACYGLTKALARNGVEVMFAMPQPVQPERESHVRLLTPHQPRPAGKAEDGASFALGEPGDTADDELEPIPGVSFASMPTTTRVSPYDRPAPPPTTFPITLDERRRRAAIAISLAYGASRDRDSLERAEAVHALLHDDPAEQELLEAAPEPSETEQPAVSNTNLYAGDVVGEAHRFARWCLQTLRQESFDVIHAHDWMTFPAGLALAKVTGRPLIVHVHSTEFDRAGVNIDERIFSIERAGMSGAAAVICVSHLTRTTCQQHYGIPAAKMDVVYNGIEPGDIMGPRSPILKDDKIVLFLGRITMQKGPEYFVQAAKKVLQKMDNVKFVMAGSGDLARDVIRLAAEMGIGHKVLFTGFLRGKDVERVFGMADVYVMPSVSEPFGIAPLEAIRHDVPVIISKSSGVAEVLQHALKVDFWDTDEMANKILAVLRHPPLGQTLREQADLEVRQLTWDGAAARCSQIYHRLTG